MVTDEIHFQCSKCGSKEYYIELEAWTNMMNYTTYHKIECKNPKCDNKVYLSAEHFKSLMDKRK